MQSQLAKTFFLLAIALLACYVQAEGETEEAVNIEDGSFELQGLAGNQRSAAATSSTKKVTTAQTTRKPTTPSGSTRPRTTRAPSSSGSVADVTRTASTRRPGLSSLAASRKTASTSMTTPDGYTGTTVVEMLPTQTMTAAPTTPFMPRIRVPSANGTIGAPIATNVSDVVRGGRRRNRGGVLRNATNPAEPTNINYLGNGYDIFRADPRPLSGRPDPGYAGKVFALSPNKTVSADYFLLPKNVDTFNRVALCSLTASTSIIDSFRSYQEARLKQITVGVDATYKNFSFSASVEYKNIKSTFETSRNYKKMVDSLLSCHAYTARLSELTGGSVQLMTAEFRAAVAQLAISGDAAKIKSQYLMFVGRYGTHVVTGITAGSLLGVSQVFTLDSWERVVNQYQSTDVIAKMGVNLAIFSFGLNTTVKSGYNETEINRFRSFSESSNVIRIGSQLTPDGDWAEEVLREPMPIELRLTRITNFFTSLYFPSDPNIQAKKEKLESIAHIEYCQYIAATSGGLECVIEDERSVTPSNFNGAHSSRGVFADTPNPITQGLNCKAGSTPYPVGTFDGGSLVLCLSSLSDPEGVFGGMFQTASAANQHCPGYTCAAFPTPVNINNPMTNALSCPAGYSTILLAERCTGPHTACIRYETKCTGRWFWRKCTTINIPCNTGFLSHQIWACYRFKEGATLGGFYSVGGTNMPTRAVNPATGAASCPPRYVARKILDSPMNCPAANNQAYVCL